jgi:ribosomal protein S1
VLKKGDRVKARITAIDVDNQRVSLSIKEFLPNEWQDFVDNHMAGDTVEGRVVNITDFGLFVDIYEGLEGLVHISEVDTPGGRLEDHFVVGQWVRSRILRIDDQEHKVGLTMRGVTPLHRDESRELEKAYQEKHGSGPVGEGEGQTAEAPADADVAPREGARKGKRPRAATEQEAATEEDGADDSDSDQEAEEK